MKYPSSSDAIVVGGGRMGCIIAYGLPLVGLEVTLFEMKNISSGSSYSES